MMTFELSSDGALTFELAHTIEYVDADEVSY